MPRCDVWFELHPFDDIRKEPSYKPYLGEMQKIPKVWLQKPEPEIPGGIEYPLDAMVEKYGPYFFTSSFSYMIAQAIEELNASDDTEKVLGFWGVDCSATEEYASQRPGAHFFFMKAREAGIEVFAPGESDLLHPPGLYGYCENDPWYKKQIARKREYEHAYGCALTEQRIASEKVMRLAGSLDDIQWNMNTWAHRNK